MRKRRITQRRNPIIAVALLALLAMVVGSMSPAGAALRHSHRRTHRHHMPHADSQPGVTQPEIDAARTKKTSQNWSGYVASGGKFTSISGSWTVPSVNCSSTPDGVAAMWVGIDGAGSRTVEQTGTFSLCDHGTASYAAWYEAFPAPSVMLPDPVGAGDVISATVTNTSPQMFQLVLTNQSRGWTSTNTVRVNGRLASAEAIAEAPSVQGQITPLADFGTVGFSNVAVNGAPLSSSRAIPVTMASPAGVVKAVPGGLSGGSFSVTWRHA
jgi:hypothetical protein